MKSSFAIALASVYGLTLRLLFGFLHNFMGIMSISFLILAPVIIGFLTVILWSSDRIRSGVSAFFAPWVTSLVILTITMILKIEGAICWIMIFPLFAILAGLGGILAYVFRERSMRKKTNTFNVSLLLLIPAFTGLAEGERTLVPKEFKITKELIIKGTATEVWNGLININEVEPDEKQSFISDALDFPQHLRTTLDTPAIGGKRIAFYEKGLYFEETILEYEKESLMVLDIKTDPDKIPTTIMDEHILIGGKHLDILEDTYELEDLHNGTCRLTLSSRFYINTPFNWYSGIWANYIMSDILQSELELIEKRTLSKI